MDHDLAQRRQDLLRTLSVPAPYQVYTCSEKLSFEGIKDRIHLVFNNLILKKGTRLWEKLNKVSLVDSMEP